MNKPHIFFDLDGTLLDSIPGIVASLRFTFETQLNFTRPDDILISGIGTPLDEQINVHYASEFGAPPSEAQLIHLRETYIEHNLSTHDETIRAFPGVPELLDTLTSLQVPMGIVTSKPQSTARRGLNVCGLAAHFQFVIGYDDVEHPKPHPEPVLRAVTLSNAHPKDCLFVGDAPHDILAGRRAGVDTAGVLWGPFSAKILNEANPAYLFEKVSDVIGWVADRSEP